MELVKKTNDYSILKKRNGRYGVRKPNNEWIRGEEKAKILASEGLIKLSEPKAAPAEESEEASGEVAAGGESE